MSRSSAVDTELCHGRLDMLARIPLTLHVRMIFLANVAYLARFNPISAAWHLQEHSKAAHAALVCCCVVSDLLLALQFAVTALTVH
jgi:hypothetical protein